MLAAAQLGITACTLVLGIVAEPAIAHLLEPVFDAADVPHGNGAPGRLRDRAGRRDLPAHADRRDGAEEHRAGRPGKDRAAARPAAGGADPGAAAGDLRGQRAGQRRCCGCCGSSRGRGRVGVLRRRAGPDGGGRRAARDCSTSGRPSGCRTRWNWAAGRSGEIVLPPERVVRAPLGITAGGAGGAQRAAPASPVSRSPTTTGACWAICTSRTRWTPSRATRRSRRRRCGAITRVAGGDPAGRRAHRDAARAAPTWRPWWTTRAAGWAW